MYLINKTQNSDFLITQQPSRRSLRESSFLVRLLTKIKNFVLNIFSFLGSCFLGKQKKMNESKIQIFQNCEELYDLDPKIQDIIDVHYSGDGTAGCCGLSKIQEYYKNNHFSQIRLSHFDWWLFPIDRSSQGKGERFKLNDSQIKILVQNITFLTRYIEGIRIVLSCWGWDLFNKRAISSKSQYWDGYGIRLAKLANSLQLFIKNASGDQKKNLEVIYQSVSQFYKSIVLPNKTNCSDFDLVKKYCEII